MEAVLRALNGLFHPIIVFVGLDWWGGYSRDFAFFSAGHEQSQPGMVSKAILDVFGAFSAFMFLALWIYCDLC